MPIYIDFAGGKAMVPLTYFITEFSKLDSEIKRIFFDFYSNENPFLGVAETHWQPNIDIYNTNEGIIVKAELAGIKQESLKILFKNDRLTIKGERHDYSIPEQVICQQIEIPYGDFERSLNIHHPEDKRIDADNIKATFKEGILFIYLPFLGISMEEKKIKIQVGGEQ